MAQHFLLSAKARTLSLKQIYRAGEDAANATFCKLRWPATDGGPQCPRCDCQKAYDLIARRRFKCAACHHQFSVTSGTIFACRKLSFVDLLAAICLFVNAAKRAGRRRGYQQCPGHTGLRQCYRADRRYHRHPPSGCRQYCP